MHAKLLSLSLITGLMSATAFAEPAIQPGDSLESLSKVKVSTTVNGQAGSIQDLVASGQIRILDASQAVAAPTPVGTETEIQNHSTVNTVPQTADMNTTAQMDSPAVEQTNTPAIEQNAQAASQHVETMQPNAELAVQQTEQALNQETATAPIISSSADTPVNVADRSQTDVTQEAVAAASVNAADTMMTNEAAATSEVAQPNDAVQTASETNLTDAPVNTSPEIPIAEITEN